jgi:choline kinase
MKAIILAAGIGSRLEESKPKCLTLLASGMSILEHQLSALTLHLPFDQIVVILGYHKEEILGKFPHLHFLENPLYASENTSKSLLRGLEECQDDDLLWLNGDVLFHPSVIGTILAKKRNSMLVNVGSVGEEEVKYRKDTQGCILEVSKTVSPAQGEALGINFWTKEDLGRLRRNLERCAAQDYFEKGIQYCIEEGLKVWAVPVNQELCTEIDFPEDLEKANQLLQSWKRE